MPESSAPRPTRRPEGPEASSPAGQVREILKLLAQAVSAMKIFPSHHSTVLRHLDDLSARFTSVLEERGAIEIAIQEQSFLFDGEPVYTDDHPQRSLPFFFHKDGLQMLLVGPIDSAGKIAFFEGLSSRGR